VKVPERIYIYIFILFFKFTILYWFCHISKWIRHRYTFVPHGEPSSLLPPHTIPLGRPNNPVYETTKEKLMYRTVFWTLWERERVGWFGRIYIFLKWVIVVVGFPGGSDGKKICLQCRRPGFDHLVRKISWRREWLPTPVGNAYLENSIDRGAWRATVLRVKKSWTRLSN